MGPNNFLVRPTLRKSVGPLTSFVQSPKQPSKLPTKRTSGVTPTTKGSRLLDSIRQIRSGQKLVDKGLKESTTIMITALLSSLAATPYPCPELVANLFGSVKATTTNNYAPHWKAWLAFAEEEKATPIPARDWDVACFLSVRSQTERSIANSSKRIAAINFFHSLAGLPEPGALFSLGI